MFRGPDLRLRTERLQTLLLFPPLEVIAIVNRWQLQGATRLFLQTDQVSSQRELAGGVIKTLLKRCGIVGHRSLQGLQHQLCIDPLWINPRLRRSLSL